MPFLRFNHSCYFPMSSQLNSGIKSYPSGLIVLRSSASYAKYGPLGSSASLEFFLVLILWLLESFTNFELAEWEDRRWCLDITLSRGGWRLQADFRRTALVKLNSGKKKRKLWIAGNGVGTPGYARNGGKSARKTNTYLLNLLDCLSPGIIYIMVIYSNAEMERNRRGFASRYRLLS